MVFAIFWGRFVGAVGRLRTLAAVGRTRGALPECGLRVAKVYVIAEGGLSESSRINGAVVEDRRHTIHGAEIRVVVPFYLWVRIDVVP